RPLAARAGVLGDRQWRAPVPAPRGRPGGRPRWDRRQASRGSLQPHDPVSADRPGLHPRGAGLGDHVGDRTVLVQRIPHLPGVGRREDGHGRAAAPPGHIMVRGDGRAQPERAEIRRDRDGRAGRIRCGGGGPDRPARDRGHLPSAEQRSGRLRCGGPLMDMVAGRVWADERRPVRHIDWVLLLLTVVLTIVGLVLLHSISATTPDEAAFWLVRVMKQGATAGLGSLVVVLIASFDYRFFKVYAGFIYLGALVALVLVKIPGIGATDPSGVAQRWFAIAGIQITPSEITKVCAIVMLAAILSEIRAPEPALGDLVRVLAVAAVPLVLVFIQPDIGTSIVLAAIIVGMLIVAGTRLKHLLV